MGMRVEKVDFVCRLSQMPRYKEPAAPDNAGAALYLISDTYVNSCVWIHTVRTACQHTTYPLMCANVDQMCDKMCPRRWDDRRSLDVAIS